MKNENVIPITVPKEIEYISEWKEFSYPTGHLILDKSICGCGFTEYCLTNNIPTILCSPRKVLLENKKKQHPEENVYYFKNEEEVESHDQEKEKLEKQENLEKIDNIEKQNYLVKLKKDLQDWFFNNLFSSKPPKILVTYDSLHHVLNALGKDINRFAIVVDEFQSIFLDATFKATVELDFIDDLKNCPNVLYLSATPMLNKYMNEIEYFKDLPFYKLIWDRSRVENVRIESIITKSINKELSEIIDNYRKGIYPTKVLSDGTIKESKELVIFVNSVKSICDIIKKNKLTPEETNIICSKTSVNARKLKKIKHGFGEVPLKGEYHKMFTFCTRTTYLGADFYSTSAYTVICSDCNIKTLIVDISLDLPQIVGRQRLKENMFRNEVLFLYKAETKKDASINLNEKEFNEYMKEKESKTTKILEAYNEMSDDKKLLYSEKFSRDNELYLNDFIGISRKTGKATFNYLVKIANQRAYDVSRKEYQNIVTIKKGIESIDGFNTSDESVLNKLQDIFQQFKEEFDSTGIFNEKMEILCNYCVKYFNFKQILNDQVSITVIPRNYQNYLNLLGPEKIKALEFEELKIKRYLESDMVISKSTDSIVALFEVGKRYSKAQIKEMLRELYEKLGIIKNPKATDIGEYFEIKVVNIPNSETGKKDKGFEILKRKD